MTLIIKAFSHFIKFSIKQSIKICDIKYNSTTNALLALFLNVPIKRVLNMNLATKNGDSTTAWRVDNKRLQDFKKMYVNYIFDYKTLKLKTSDKWTELIINKRRISYIKKQLLEASY